VIRLVRTDASDKDFAILVDQLDVDLASRDGEDHDFYHQFNAITDIKHAIVAYSKEEPIACGAIKQFDDSTMEVKRIYVPVLHRSKGLASQVLRELESWAVDLGMERCVLETGKKQPEAIGLYKKAGYQVISNYGQYIGIENSVCFEKWLK